MKNMINDIPITDQTLSVMGEWFPENEPETKPEVFIEYLEKAKDTFLRAMFINHDMNGDILESLEGILVVQDELKRLVPGKGKCHG